MPANFKIAVIGAGPAGCMLARLLHLANIEVTVFEGESSPNYRRQGGSLDLHEATGLAAMREAKLWDEFMKHARYDSQYMAMADQHLKYYVQRGTDQNGEDLIGERPEIDRALLRQVLTESLPDGMIRWGHHLKEARDDGTLVFEHATVSGFDLIIGAEGAWSKVRKLIDPAAQPVYSGVGGHEMRILDAEKTAPATYALVRRGTVFTMAMTPGRRLTLQQMGDGSINIYAMAVHEEGADWYATEKCGYDVTDQAATRRHLLDEEYVDWAPELRDALDRATGPCSARSLYLLPVGWRWGHRRGVTLIGDAAHLMGPFAGEGVNMALEDALKLSREIIVAASEAGEGKEGLEALDRHIEAFENEMFPRAERIQRLTDDLGRIWFWSPDVTTAVARALSRHLSHRLPAVARPFATAAAYAFVYAKSIWA